MGLLDGFSNGLSDFGDYVGDAFDSGVDYVSDFDFGSFTQPVTDFAERAFDTFVYDTDNGLDPFFSLGGDASGSIWQDGYDAIADMFSDESAESGGGNGPESDSGVSPQDGVKEVEVISIKPKEINEADNAKNFVQSLPKEEGDRLDYRLNKGLGLMKKNKFTPEEMQKWINETLDDNGYDQDTDYTPEDPIKQSQSLAEVSSKIKPITKSDQMDYQDQYFKARLDGIEAERNMGLIDRAKRDIMGSSGEMLVGGLGAWYKANQAEKTAEEKKRENELNRQNYIKQAYISKSGTATGKRGGFA